MTPAAAFRALYHHWHQDAASQQVDIHTAELVSHVARVDHALCVGILPKADVPRLFGLTFFLNGYGVKLSQRYRLRGDGVLVYVGRVA